MYKLFVLTQCNTLSCTCTANTRSSMIEDAAMKDERGDDMPDNESNEWEVGQVLICSSQSRDVFAVSHRSFDIYLCTLHAGRWCEPSAAWFVSSYWPSYFIARSRVQKKVCYFQFEYFCAKSSNCTMCNRTFSLQLPFTTITLPRNVTN